MNAKLGEPVDEILETVGERGGELMRTSQGTQGSAGGLWAMVLAGGDGIRLQPLTRRLYGEPRPKQFAALIGTCSQTPSSSCPVHFDSCASDLVSLSRGPRYACMRVRSATSSRSARVHARPGSL